MTRYLDIAAKLIARRLEQRIKLLASLVVDRRAQRPHECEMEEGLDACLHALGRQLRDNNGRRK